MSTTNDEFHQKYLARAKQVLANAKLRIDLLKDVTFTDIRDNNRKQLSLAQAMTELSLAPALHTAKTSKKPSRKTQYGAILRSIEAAEKRNTQDNEELYEIISKEFNYFLEAAKEQKPKAVKKQIEKFYKKFQSLAEDIEFPGSHNKKAENLKQLCTELLSPANKKQTIDEIQRNFNGNLQALDQLSVRRVSIAESDSSDDDEFYAKIPPRRLTPARPQTYSPNSSTSSLEPLEPDQPKYMAMTPGAAVQKDLRKLQSRRRLAEDELPPLPLPATTNLRPQGLVNGTLYDLPRITPVADMYEAMVGVVQPSVKAHTAKSSTADAESLNTDYEAVEQFQRKEATQPPAPNPSDSTYESMSTTPLPQPQAPRPYYENTTQYKKKPDKPTYVNVASLEGGDPSLSPAHQNIPPTPKPRPDSEKAKAFNSQGKTYYQSGDYENAAKCGEEAVKIAPQNAAYQRNLGYTYLKLNRYDDAIKSYEMAKELEPTNSNSLNILGSLYEEKNEYAKALECYSAASKLEPENAKFHHLQGFMHRALKQYDKAVESYDKAIEFDKDNPLYHFNKAGAHYRLEQFEKFLTSYGKAKALDPSYDLERENMEPKPPKSLSMNVHEVAASIGKEVGNTGDKEGASLRIEVVRPVPRPRKGKISKST